MSDKPDLMERMVQLSRAKQQYEDAVATDLFDHYAIQYIALLEAECKRVGILFDQPED